MDPVDLFIWFEDSALGTLIRESMWLFPAIQAIHLVGIAALGGAILAVDLRLLNAVLRHLPPAEVLRETRLWMAGSILLMVSTGIPLFLSQAVRYYFNTSFWIKIGGLIIVVLFTYLVRNPRIRVMGNTATTSAGLRSLALISISLWLVVAFAGRWVGFS